MRIFICLFIWRVSDLVLFEILSRCHDTVLKLKMFRIPLWVEASRSLALSNPVPQFLRRGHPSPTPAVELPPGAKRFQPLAFRRVQRASFHTLPITRIRRIR